jgi:hypothetical protein
MMRISVKLALTAGVLALLTTSAVGCKDEAGKGSATVSAEAGKPAPQIVAPAPSYHYGKIKQGLEVEHVFKIKNAGNAPLLIHKAKGS